MLDNADQTSLTYKYKLFYFYFLIELLASLTVVK